MTDVMSIKNVSVDRGFEYVHYTGDDGWPAARGFDVVMVEAHDGRKFVAPSCRFVSDEDGSFPTARYVADTLAETVRQQTTIDPAEWNEVQPPDETFEERYGPYGTAWFEEQEDRAAWGAGGW